MKILKFIRRNVQNILTLVALLIAFTGFTLPDLINWILSLTAPPEPDYIIYSLEEPILFKRENLPLSVAEKYYIIINIALREETVAPEGLLRFSLSFENKGKIIPKQCYLLIYFIDPLWQIRGFENITIPSFSECKEINIEYYLPTRDQCILGEWNILVIMKEKENIVSYIMAPYKVKEPSPTPWWIYAIIAISLIMVLSMLIESIVERLRKKDQKRRDFFK